MGSFIRRRLITPPFYFIASKNNLVELASLLKDCGFESVDIYDDLAGAEYDNNAKRLIAVAQK